ncbi:hypothetical protein [Paraburkholderia fynbosensis]|uniref:hypothetical protein n=1 Tax=Paraburkholderia fynbosensis TaxID=1200993 RepID=UPI00158309F8|nr:hypothetical protein [Paraburkholderia fynbosensis]
MPVQLIGAMPAAALLPQRNAVGSAHNIGSAVTTPETASVSPIIDSGELSPLAAHRLKPLAATSDDMPAALARAVRVTTHRDHEISVTEYGIIVSRPINSGLSMSVA